MKTIFLFLFLISSPLLAQSFSNGFNFYLPFSDTTTQSFLPAFPKVPIGNNDFVSINSDGKFSINGNRIRFWGANTSYDGAFPSKSIAGYLAGRLRKFGVNLARFEGLDGNPPKGLLGPPTTRQLDLTSLDIFENYVAALKENGIHVDIVLNYVRNYVASDQVVDYDSLPSFGQCVNFIDPYILQLHKEYARELLSHVNPYTGIDLVHDPVMAMVEITNENSLYRFWRDNELKPISNGGVLPVYYSSMLDSLWNKFLTDKYSSTANLRNAWNIGAIAAAQSEQIINGGFESGTSNWIFYPSGMGTCIADTSNPHSGRYCGKVIIDTSTGSIYDVSFGQTNLSVKKDSLYTITFWVRSDVSKNASVFFQDYSAPYQSYGGSTFQMTPNWQRYTFDVKATNDFYPVWLYFCVGGDTGTYWFDDISVSTGTGINGLLAGDSLELKNIGRMDYEDCPSYTTQRVKDLSEFYISLERNYFKEMLSFLKDTLGVKVPILGTNWNVGPADLASTSDADYVDNHAYWELGGGNTPMLRDTSGGVIAPLFSGVPVVNKPFTVCSYNHPAPNQYQVESILFSSCYSAFNDIDALMYFKYVEADNWGEDMLDDMDGTGFSRNSLYMSFFPTAAVVFRNGLVEPSIAPITVNYTADTLYSLPKYDIATAGSFSWWGPSFFDRKISLTHAIKTDSYFSSSTTDFNSLPSAGASPYTTDTQEMTWDMTKGTISVVTDEFEGLGGYLSNLKLTPTTCCNMPPANPPLQIVNFDSSDFGVVTWLSLTDTSLSSSRLSLITLGSKIQNTGMVWNADNSGVTNWGTAPTIIYPLSIVLDLWVNADSIRVLDLGPMGEPTGRSKIYYPIPNPQYPVPPTISKIKTRPKKVGAGSNLFTITLDQNISKTLWFGVETQWSIDEPSLRISWPTGKFTCYGKDTLRVLWQGNFVSNVKLEYTITNGRTWSLIADSINNSIGYYDWAVPDTNSDSSLIRITADGASNVFDVSDSLFSIQKSTRKNLITNGDFTDDLTGWSLGLASPASASFTVSNDMCCVSIQNGGTASWNVNLCQYPIKIENGKTYDISLGASADQARSIDVGVAQTCCNYTSHADRSFNLSTAMKTYTFSFTMKDSTDEQAQLMINVGNSTIGVKIDSVDMHEHDFGNNAVSQKGGPIPTSYSLLQNFPNPFNPTTRIHFGIPKVSKVSLVIYDVLGRKVVTLVDKQLVPGYYDYNWNASSMASGVYFYRLRAGSFTETKKLVLLK
jgi:hypothetical protein